ncbi:Gfo/Idh/MocA family oxidoreductase [candidate division KSB1 bacterium]|nr:Gfo/Idh/MocA family oxidoreductase [candidate division KSB1 bacterium]
MNRRTFLQRTALAGALSTLPFGSTPADERKIRVSVIGCGSVSHSYLPHLSQCPYAELVSTCDIIPERARAQAERFNIPNHYPHIDQLLAGADFDLLVNLTDMQEHEHLNRQALAAGLHVWSEKPLANSFAAGQKLLELAKKNSVRFWGAPAMVESPAFASMAKILATGKLGKIAAAHAEYGHTGPNWSAFFYEKGGGSLPDLAVYNLTTLTGLLGPAKAVTAMTSIITPTRQIDQVGEFRVVAEDNAMLLLDHGDGLISHVQSGFNYFNPYGHEGKGEQRHTVQIIGTKGVIGLVGYDWEPQGVDLATEEEPAFARHIIENSNFVWQMGASRVAECLVTGNEPLMTPEHALHVLEIIQATRESSEKGRRIELHSTFKWPIISA